MADINDYSVVSGRIISEERDENGNNIVYNAVDMLKGEVKPVGAVVDAESYGVRSGRIISEEKDEKGNNVVYNLVDLMKESGSGGDLSNYYTKDETDEKIDNTGHSLGLSVSSDYEMSVELKDKNGEVIDTKSVDLPVGGMVTGLSYDEGIITQSLQSGEELECDISDLVKGKVDVANNAGFHNSIYRGKDLTNVYTIDEICSRISSGSFDDLYIGDYFDVTINTSIGGEEEVRCLLAGFNSIHAIDWAHHAVIVTKDCFKIKAQMNETDDTTIVYEGQPNLSYDGYLGSKMNIVTLPVYEAAVESVFNEHLYSSPYTVYFGHQVDENAVSIGTGLNGKTWAAAVNWKGLSGQGDVRKINLLNEIDVYGHAVRSSSSCDYIASTGQLPLFRLNPQLISAGIGFNPAASNDVYWLNNVASAMHFSAVRNNYCMYYGASESLGVRPYFVIV